MQRYDPPRGIDWICLPMRVDIAGQYVLHSDAQATIARLTKELAQARAEAAAAYESVIPVAQQFCCKGDDYSVAASIRALATEPGTTALAEMLDAETRACAEMAGTSKEECMWAELNDEARVLRSMQLAILARIDQRKEVGE